MRFLERLIGDHRLALEVGYCLSICGLMLGLATRRSAAARWLAAPLVAVPAALAGSALELAARVFLSAEAFDRWRGLLAVAGAGVSGVLAFALARWQPAMGRADKFRRGAALLPAAPRAWLRQGAARDARPVHFAGHAVPRVDECRHFKVIGTTGTGKTSAIRALLCGALARGDAAVVADPDGVYAAEFLDLRRGDRVLNPFDSRSARWDLFAEIDRPQDADHLARSLISEAHGEDRTWRAYARHFVAALLRRLQRAGAANAATLLRLLTAAPVEELAALLADTAVAPYLGADNARFFASVRAIAATHCTVLEHLGESAMMQPLGVRRWVRGTVAGRPAVLFLTYRATELASLSGAIAAWMRLAIFETMELAVRDHRLWFIVDELDALGSVDGLKDALVRLRKYGGRCVLGLQSIAQAAAIYGRYDAQTIVENCGNTLLLRCSAGGADGTSHFAARLIGEREVLRAQITAPGARWHRPAHGGRTVSWQPVIEPAVLAAELEQLPDRAGFLKLASAREWRRIRATDWS
jgi:hypothetical protein